MTYTAFPCILLIIRHSFHHPFLWDVINLLNLSRFSMHWAKKRFSTEKGEVVKEAT